jgi:hypothetical protein
MLISCKDKDNNVEDIKISDQPEGFRLKRVMLILKIHEGDQLEMVEKGRGIGFTPIALINLLM